MDELNRMLLAETISTCVRDGVQVLGPHLTIKVELGDGGAITMVNHKGENRVYEIGGKACDFDLEYYTVTDIRAAYPEELNN